MLEAGEDPLFVARRLVRIASEDVGLADPQALRITLAAKEAYDFLGTPEGELALAEAAVYLACAPKSNAVYTAFEEARADVQARPAEPVPLHLRNAPTGLMTGLGYGARLSVRPRRARRRRGPGAPARRAPRAHVLSPRAARGRAGDPRAPRALARRAPPPEDRGGPVTRSPEPPRPPESRSPGRPEAKRLRVGVIFGGRSGEHEVSLASAASVMAAIDRRATTWSRSASPATGAGSSAAIRSARWPRRPACRSRCRRASRQPGPPDAGQATSPASQTAGGLPAGLGREPRRRVPPAPRPLRRGRHHPGPARAGRRALRGRRACSPRPSAWTRRP